MRGLPARCTNFYVLTVEEWSAQQYDPVGDVRVGRFAARVVDHVPFHGEAEQIPLAIGHVVTQVSVLSLVQQIYLFSIVNNMYLRKVNYSP